MLFVNFLCLLYLMLLVNGLTVSKNIDNSYFDERVDSLHDLEYTTRYKSKHDKFLHKHRRIKSGVTTPTSKIPVRVTTPQANSTEATYKAQHYKLHKSTKRRIGGFWRKFKIKEDKKLEREKRLKYQTGNLQYKRPLYGSGYEGIDNKLVTKKKKYSYPISFEKKKRETRNEVTNISNKQKNEKSFKNMEVNITPYEKFNGTVKETTHMKAISTDEELKNVLNTMTTKVAELKHLYGMEKYKPIYPSTHKVPYTTKHTTTQSTTENLDIPGTAQLEALLNDIKEKALHLIVEQNPDITDLITNTVTEATFEADPLLTHLEINSPAFSLYTFITLNSDFGKRDINITKSDDEKSTVVDMSTNYNREGRSVAEDAMTAAQSIEDILQKEMKNIYKKVKNKVSGDFRKEVEKVKTTLKPQSKKTCSKDPPAKQPITTKPATEINKKSKSTTQLLQNRVDRKSGKHTKVTEQELTTTPTADDYALLTLYEQMLTKTCQNNIMNMVTAQDRIKRNKRNKKLVSKRNFETLFDQNLKEDVKKLYEDREEIPDDLEYNFEVNIPEVSTAETATEPDYSQSANNEAQSQHEMEDDGNTEMTPYDDNSYEGLSSKISYNEYVNGYKHYLNFQKEQANEKFSNLIRYQAHRHHSVDDIGKYILNKIPQLPSRDKRFFEYEDDHDSSTKNEESWFKKHFYMFIDNGTPKKYHTSQTVSLKSPTPDPYDKSGRKMEDMERSELDDKLRVSPEAEENAIDINLEKLSQVLEEHKATPAALPVQDNAFKESVLKNAGKRHGHIFKSFTPPHIINRVFGKDHKGLEGSEVESNNLGLIANSLEAGYLKDKNNKDISFLCTNELNRKKRNTKELQEKPITFGDKLMFQTKKSAKLVNLTKKKTDNAKVGCVDIGLVVPPTAIVKLRGTKRKDSKLKKLLQKLHLSKSNKKVKRNNQSTKYMRKQRSNPFQKLKNIFKSTPKSKVLKAGSHLSDYDIMSPHIDTFKPMKYNKVLDIEEMKKQIPNITAEMSVDPSAKYASRVNSWNPRTTEKRLTDFTVHLNTTLTSLHINPATNSPPLVEGYNKFPITKTTKKSKSHNIESLLKVKVETKSSSGPYKQIISFPQHMPLNDIKDQVENIFIKITSDPSNKINPTDDSTESKYLMNNKMPVNKDILKLDINSFYTKMPKKKKYSKPNSKIRPNSEIHTILDLEQNSEFVDDDSYVQTSKPKFNVNEITAQSPVSMLIPTDSLLTLGHSVHDEEKEKYKPYPDYFSDLLMWNKDILNSDKVPSPWRDILKNMNRELDYTTPDISEIQQEIIQINDGTNVNVNNFKETPISTYIHKSITPRNWLQSMVVEKPPIGKSILIEQEKKFVKFDPKITDRHLKAADFVNELNKFAKTLSDETKYKLNKIHAVPEHCLGNKDNKDQSAILVDTTLLAYDDDVNYISTLTPRELSKNALKSANVENNAAASLKAKTNKQPLQYFATPLPMKMTDFEDFLKANRLDVESVTSPIVDLPTMDAYASKKSSRAKSIKKVRPTIAKKKHKPTRTKTKFKTHERRVTKASTLSIVNNMKDSENQFDYLNDLEKDIFNDYDFEEKERFKRYNEHYNSYFTNFNQDTNQWSRANKGMQKHKPDVPKQFINEESDFKSNEIAETTEDMTPKDFEITIINFGDINKLTDEYAPIQSETTTTTEASEKFLKNAIKTPLSVDFIEKGSKDTEFLHKLHNDLFYDHAYTKRKETTTGMTETIKIEETTMPTPPLAFHEAVWKKMPIKTYHEPKRVRISSQSYKYDIIYHHPEKYKKDRGTHLPSYIITTEVTTPEELYPSYNTSLAQENQMWLEVTAARRGSFEK
ncbi:hypothetical protein O3G_MSEX003329 [Manduca sexta]|uniref:Uncharacterized protein n=1 Tax=Manduca sexta TaxID=7130 RepID=A0A921YRW8_MANSE|nr:hypothetical protein O3G_MSEX003329 [Manduca sexta]